MSDSAVFYRSPADEYAVMVRGEGCRLWDDTGKQYLDLSSGLSATAGIGHSRADIADAMAKQAKTLSFVHGARVTNDQQELLAKRLVDLAPDGVGKVMFTSGGSEANELALRISRQYHLANDDWERTKIISLSPSYHGATIGSLSMTGRWDTKRSYAPHLMHAVNVTAPVNFRGPFAGLDDEELATRAAGAVEDSIEATGPHTIAAFIAEPISPSAGMAVPPQAYWLRIRELCDRYGVLFIADEIITGAGRTGEFFGMEHFGVVPDLTNLAKGLSGGYVPLGATLVRDEVVGAISASSRRMGEVHTFSGAPLSCATGLAVLDVIERESLVEAARKKGAVLKSMLERQLLGHRYVGEVRGRGLMCMVEYVRSKKSREKFPEEARVAGSLWDAMIRRGVIAPSFRMSSSLVGDCTAFFPALTVNEEELEQGVTALRESIEEQSPQWS